MSAIPSGLGGMMPGMATPAMGAMPALGGMPAMGGMPSAAGMNPATAAAMASVPSEQAVWNMIVQQMPGPLGAPILNAVQQQVMTSEALKMQGMSQLSNMGMMPGGMGGMNPMAAMGGMSPMGGMGGMNPMSMLTSMMGQLSAAGAMPQAPAAPAPAPASATDKSSKSKDAEKSSSKDSDSSSSKKKSGGGLLEGLGNMLGGLFGG